MEKLEYYPSVTFYSRDYIREKCAFLSGRACIYLYNLKGHSDDIHILWRVQYTFCAS